MPDIFISYSRADKATARRFAEGFGAEGLEVWWDNELRAGETFDMVIEASLRAAKVVVVLWSPNSVSSRWVRAEATLADRLNTLAPVVIAPCDLPIIFELTHAARMEHWQGDRTAPVWLQLIAEIRRRIPEIENAAAPRTLVVAEPASARIDQARPGERRQVTVLHMGLVQDGGSEADPEDWRETVVAFHAEATAVVRRYDGDIGPPAGDALMALFGAVQTREDDAIRAVQAGLALIEAAAESRPRLQVQIGVESGALVVAGDAAAAFGAPITQAAQLHAQAAPGCVVMGPQTATLAGGFFELESYGARAFRAVTARANHTRFDLSRARGLSQFVGRSADLRALDEALDLSIEGAGQVVGLIAEPGAGKSRLCFEFLERCRGRGLQIFEGRAVAHGRNIPYLPILDLLRSFFSIAPEDRSEAARAKIETRAIELDPRLGDALPLLFDFMAVPDSERPAPRLDPDLRQRQLIGVMRHLISTASAERPTVTLIEDLHWLDEASAQFIEQMVQGRSDLKNLMLLNFRPEFRADWMQMDGYRQLPLAPLGPGAVADLLADLLGPDPSVSVLTAPILARTKGNPFFVEEIVQTLIETRQLQGKPGAYQLGTRIDRLDVPATVQAVVAARIDRLPPGLKRLLQTASVIGKDFAEPLLAAVADLSPGDLNASLSALRRAEFIYEESPFPVAKYAFKHPLTQEVAQAGLLNARRRQVHASVAKAIERQEAGSLAENAALLAHHWEEANEPLMAASWHQRAAIWAGLTNAAEGFRHWERVLKLISNLPQTEEVLQLGVAGSIGALGLAWRLGTPTTRAREIFEVGLGMARASGDSASEAVLHGVFGCVLGLVDGASDDYARYGREAADLADLTDNPGLKLAMRAFWAFGCVFSGRLTEGLAVCEGVAQGPIPDPAFGAEFTGYSPFLGILVSQAWILGNLGRITETLAVCDRGEALARAHGDSEILTWLQLPRLEADILVGDAASAREHARRALAAAESSATPQARFVALMTRGVAHRLSGEWPEAASVLGEAVAATVNGANRMVEGWARSELATAFLGLGDHDRAEREAILASTRATAQHSRIDELRGALALAEVLLARADAASLSRAEEAIELAQTRIDEFGAVTFQPQVCECRARLAGLRGENPAQEMEAARKFYLAMGATARAEKLQIGASTQG